MKLYIYIVFCLMTGFCFAQSASQVSPTATKSVKAQRFFDAAIQLYNAHSEEKALLELNKAISEDSTYIDALMLQSEIFKASGASVKEIAVYKKIIRLQADKNPKVYLNLGIAEYTIGDYKNARTHLQKALLMTGLTKLARQSLDRYIARVNFAIKAMAKPVPFSPKNLGSNINTKKNEYWPSLTADEQTLITTVENFSTRPQILGLNKGQEDLYTSLRSGNAWTKSLSLGPPINTDDNEGAQNISFDGLFIFFTGCGKPNSLGHCDIYFSEKNDAVWNNPQNMGRPINSTAWDSQPCMSSDGRTMYFVSNRPGGKGGMDIWSSVMDDFGIWGTPQNLGDSINTVNDEMSPFIHEDNNTLYFASNGHTGMGGFDIFFSRKNIQGVWRKPYNIGYPINTFADEFGLVVNATGNKAYFSSDRDSVFGRDIYEFELYEAARPMVVDFVKGIVYDSDTKEEIKADFELSDIETDQIIAKNHSSQYSGEYLVCLPTDRDLGLNISKKGYIYHSENFSLRDLQKDSLMPYSLNIALQTIKVGRKEILRNLFYEVDRYELKARSKGELRHLISFMNDNPEVSIEIGGHTDNTGTATHNKELSENRARLVYDYLVQHGVAASRLSYVGYSDTMPIADNKTEAGKAQNRRTEFKISDIKPVENK